MKYDESKENLEKILTAIFGSIGTIAILINLYIKGFELENVLDATKDIAGLIVVVSVFLLASRILRRKKQEDFITIFEEHLKEWADQNKCLIDSSSSDETRGTKDPRRSYFMVVDHSNFVTNKLASEVPRNLKGAFLNLPIKSDMNKQELKIEFQFNATTFKRQSKYITPEGEPDLKNITDKFAERVNGEFGSSLNIHATPQNDRFSITLRDIEKFDDTARKLINLVEFVKTMILALA